MIQKLTMFMPTLEVASTAQVESLIVPLRVAPLTGDFQVTADPDNKQAGTGLRDE